MVGEVRVIDGDFGFVVVVVVGGDNGVGTFCAGFIRFVTLVVVDSVVGDAALPILVLRRRGRFCWRLCEGALR